MLRNQKGFTLFELLVSIMLVCIILVVIATTGAIFKSSVSFKNNNTTVITQEQEAQSQKIPEVEEKSIDKGSGKKL